MKKIVSFALALVMLFCAFVSSSCTSSSNDNIKQSSNSSSSDDNIKQSSNSSSSDDNIKQPSKDPISDNNIEQSKTQKEEEFYNLVDETKKLLDIVADDIYIYWYDCIYNDKYLEDINYAIDCAIIDNAANLNTIIENTAKIKDLYKEIKEGKIGSEAKAVIQAYNNYYVLVVEVSGSFNSYSASKETCKKELARALDNFSFELD